MPDVTRERVRDELLRMEEDCIHSGKAHFNASARWAVWNYVFGIPSVILSTAAGAAFSRTILSPRVLWRFALPSSRR
ncbi:hypothetical protein ACN2CC_06620 [Mesorhizobium muleiense]|uniref:hypothetical protein n=1 Tax=Mesorhizobium muleiense TaxID=1004279 RepID=UPI003AFB6737